MKEVEVIATVNKSEMEYDPAFVLRFMTAYDANKGRFCDIINKIKTLRLHEEMMNYCGTDNEFDTIAKNYREVHSSIDLLTEACGICTDIISVSRFAQRVGVVDDPILPRFYQTKMIDLETADELAIAALITDTNEMISDFMELYSRGVAEKKKK